VDAVISLTPYHQAITDGKISNLKKPCKTGVVIACAKEDNMQISRAIIIKTV